MLKENCEDKIVKYLSVLEIIAVIGSRQSGKTTLSKKIFKPLKIQISGQECPSYKYKRRIIRRNTQSSAEFYGEIRKMMSDSPDGEV